MSQTLPYSRKLSRISQFYGYTLKFSSRNLGVASFGAAKASNSRKFSPRKTYFSPIHESFLLRKFPAIQYIQARAYYKQYITRNGYFNSSNVVQHRNLLYSLFRILFICFRVTLCSTSTWAILFSEKKSLKIDF